MNYQAAEKQIWRHVEFSGSADDHAGLVRYATLLGSRPGRPPSLCQPRLCCGRPVVGCRGSQHEGITRIRYEGSLRPCGS